MCTPDSGTARNIPFVTAGLALPAYANSTDDQNRDFMLPCHGRSTIVEGSANFQTLLILPVDRHCLVLPEKLRYSIA